MVDRVKKSKFGQPIRKPVSQFLANLVDQLVSMNRDMGKNENRKRRSICM